MTETRHMGTHLRELSESYLMNTNMKGLDGFQKSFCTCSLVESSLSIERVKVKQALDANTEQNMKMLEKFSSVTSRSTEMLFF